MFIRSWMMGLFFISSAWGAEKNVKEQAEQVTQLIAHRGSCSDRPENTLASYRQAIAAGATAFEIDVRTTKDGELVSLHDATVDRTTNGKGKLADLTWAEVQKLDAGSWFDPKFQHERIPAVRDILPLARGKIDVLLDLKGTGEPYAQQVAALVKQFGEPRRTIVGVRSVEQAKLFRQLLPDSRQLGLIPRPDDIEAFAAAGVETIRLWPHWLTDEKLVPRVRQAKCQLHLGTENGTPAEVLPLLSHSPDSLSSDNPAQLLRTLNELKTAK